MNEKLISYFSYFTKEELMDTLDSFGQSYKRSQKKAALVEQLATYISEHTEEWLGVFTERDLKLIQKAVSAKPLEAISIDDIDFPTGVATIPFFEPAPEALDSFFISEEMHEVLRPHIDHVIEEKERSGLFDIDRLLLGLVNLWGVISLHDFIGKMQEISDNEEDSRKMAYLFANSPMLGLVRRYIDGECYLVSPLVYEVEDLLEGRKQFSDIQQYRSFTMEQGHGTGTNAPYCIYECEESKAVRQSLTALGLDDHEVAVELSHMFVNAQYAMTDEGAETLFKVINDRMEMIPSFELYKEYIDSVADYANSVPKWLLKGQSSKEAGILKISIKLEDQSGEPELDEEEEMPGGMFFGPSEGVGVPSAEGLSDFFRYGIAFRHVAPDAPCPCGSGLSYRRCHGKNLN